MKKLFVILGGLVSFVLLAAFLVPILFKDKIKEKIDQQIAETVNAHVYFDPSKFSISLLRNFPNVTVSLDDFGVVGVEEFANDTLISVNSFKIVMNLKSILLDKQMRVSGIYLNEPKINVKVLENGKANYDIMKGTGEEETEVTEDSAEVKFGIDKWQITNGQLIYHDIPLHTYAEIKGLNHKGSGDFTLDVFDIKTHTVINSLSARYEGVEYLTRKRLESDMTLNMNMPEFRFTFKDNFVKLNDFRFGFDGSVAMPEEDIDVDIRFAARENTFKSILSLVPGVFMEGFENIKTEGDFSFGGFVKGTYSDVKGSMPAFNLNLKVNNGKVQYPDLPVAINNILVDMEIDNEDGIIDNTLIDVRNFQMDMGKNPVKMNLMVKGLKRSEIDAKVKANINLQDFNSMIPMQGTTLKGLFDLNLSAKGVYDSLENTIPAIDMKMTLKEGFVKTADFPIPLEKINIVSSIINKSGKMEETFINVDDFNMLMDGERLSASLFVRNMNDYTWDLKASGGIDLEKITRIYPLENMQMAGLIKGNFETHGKMSDLDAERYDKMPTSGAVTVNNFRFTSTDLPQGFTINNASAAFNPDKLILKTFEGSIGKSPIKVDGYLSNYIAYIFKDDVIKGVMNFSSDRFDLNEWMTDEENTATEGEEEPLEVLPVPANIDFVLKSTLKEVLYDNLVLSDMSGDIIVKDGWVRMSGLKFKTLGGRFAMNGSYDPRIMDAPLFDFDMKIEELPIRSAYEHFNTIKVIAPIAQHINGTFSTDFNIKGKLNKEMSPVYSSLIGGGLVKVGRAAIVDSKVLNMVSSTTSLSNTSEVQLKDLILKAEIKDNKLMVEPFDIMLDNFKTTVAGSNTLDGLLNYNMKMDIPAGTAGAALNNIVSSLSGGASGNSSNIRLNLNIGGTYDKPTVGLGKAEVAGTPAERVKSAVTNKVSNAKEEVKEDIDQKKKEAEAKLREEQERLKKEAEEKAKEEVDKAKENVKDKAKENLKNMIKKPF